MKQQHIVIGGGSGFVGRALSSALQARGDQVTIISRHAGDGRLTWDDIRLNGLPACDVVINLAGKHILDLSRRWNAAYRDELVRSRVETTELLVQAINAAPQPPDTFISVAGKCFYGSQAFRRAESYFDLDEHSQPIGLDYPAELVRLWEAAALGVSERVRHVKIRLGIVLANRPPLGGAKGLGAYGVFPLLKSLFSRGFAFSMGSGAQPFPWVHVDDVVGFFVRAIDDRTLQGVFNLVSPGIVSNREFMKQLAERLNKPLLGAIPAWLIKAVIGVQRSTILLLGQRVRPARTMASGYRFKYPDVPSCLANLTTEAPLERAR